MCLTAELAEVQRRSVNNPVLITVAYKPSTDSTLLEGILSKGDTF